MSEDLNKLRAEFEAWYCEQAARDAGLTFVPSEIAELREGDGYGGRGALNGKWEAYQALVPVLRARLQAAGERATKAESELDRMREALEPFGRLGDFIEEQCSGFADSDKLAVCYDATDGSDDAGDPYQDAFVELGTLRVVHFQKARAALSLSPDGGEAVHARPLSAASAEPNPTKEA